MASIPLFPLNTLLFPKGQVSLQIFEARYVDLVRHCLRDDSGFGVVQIRKGGEVARPGMNLELYPVGTYGRIIDWHQLESGLLGVVVEGQYTFRISEVWQENNRLYRAEVSPRLHDSVSAGSLDVGEEFQEYVTLLRSLSQHPAVQALKLEMRFDNLREVAWRLSELLPLSNRDRQVLLELDNPLSRLEQIDLYIRALSR